MRVSVRGVGVEVHLHALVAADRGVAGYSEATLQGGERVYACGRWGDVDCAETVSEIVWVNGAIGTPPEGGARCVLFTVDEDTVTAERIAWAILVQTAHRSPETLRKAEVSAEAEQGDGRKIGLWRKGGIDGGKYLVLRRDGTVFEHPFFVLGARDPAAPAALMAYSVAAEDLGLDPLFAHDVSDLAAEFYAYREEHGAGEPDAGPVRVDDPATVARMVKQGSGA